MKTDVLVCCNGSIQDRLQLEREEKLDEISFSFLNCSPALEQSVRRGDYDYLVVDSIASEQLHEAVHEAHVPYALWADGVATVATYDHRFPSRTSWVQIEGAVRYRLRDLSHLPSDGVENSEVWVLDDEDGVREVITHFLEDACQLPVRCFRCFDEVLEGHGSRPGIILADGDLRDVFAGHTGYQATENFLKLMMSLYPDLLVLRWSGDLQSLPSIWGGAFAKPCDMAEVAHCMSNSWSSHVWSRAYR